MTLRNSIIYFIFTTICFSFGYKVTQHSWDGIVFFLDSNHRVPAAVPQKYDFTGLYGHKLNELSQERLLKTARIIYQKEHIGIELGHFYTKDRQSNKKVACNVYDKISLTFFAGDTMVNGAPSVLNIESSCSYKRELQVERINPIWIPLKELTTESPKLSNFELNLNSEDPVYISFENLGNSWPKIWTLRSVRLHNELGEEIFIDSNAIKKIRSSGLAFKTNY